MYRLLFLLLLFQSCASIPRQQENKAAIAFLSDVHLMDIYGSFSDSNYKGIPHPITGKYTLLRTMKSQLESTRLFNENYFAFLAALDDIAKKGIKTVVLPGDFSDDGQPIHVRGLKRILEEYTNKHGIHFYITTGNHDVVQPFLTEAGKTDFLGSNGNSQAIMSKEGMNLSKITSENPVVITKEIGSMGYAEILTELKAFGFFPKKDDLYWETPFTTYNLDSYTFEAAIQQATIEKRCYKMAPFAIAVPDLSYLVELPNQVWLLAIDANVYLPKADVKKQPNAKTNFNSAGVGYNDVLLHKKHLIDWVAKVAQEAKKRNKTLIAFSHYPLLDYNDDATVEMKDFFGRDKMQLHRVPNEEVGQIFANAGIRLHFGGHMHINDTGFRKYQNGKALFNIQVPSLAAYIPAYKVMTVNSKSKIQISTVVLDSVPEFKTLFPFYEQEYKYLKDNKSATIWDKKILQSSNYRQFTKNHLKQLVNQRLLKNDWPDFFKNTFVNMSSEQIFAFADVSNSKQKKITKAAWNGLDMIQDFYKFRSADELAYNDIDKDLIKQYDAIIDSFCKKYSKMMKPTPIETSFYRFCIIFKKTMRNKPANAFNVNLKKNTIQ